MPQLLDALAIARERGLDVPIVYNSGGYDDVEMLKLCEGVVDIYMPDFKYWDPEVGRALSDVDDYPARARAAFTEMHRQVGDLKMDEDGVAVSGLLVRHLVLPNGLAGTAGVAGFLADEISKDTYINVMGQYHPCFQANKDPRLMRSPSATEMKEAFELAARAGLHRFDDRRPSVLFHF
jgi:putative pyruvate formate lyase activating enzyme